MKLLSLSSGDQDRLLVMQPGVDAGGELGITDLAAFEAGQGGDMGAHGLGNDAQRQREFVSSGT